MTEKLVLANSDFVALVDDQDYALLLQYRWYLCSNGYIKRTYRNGTKMGNTYLHRFLIPQYKRIDHIDTNKLNNQRANLRDISVSHNQANRRVLAYKTDITTSRYKGVSWHKHKNCWQATIKVLYKQIYLGYFTNELEAAKAYNDAAIKYFGEFARINEL